MKMIIKENEIKKDEEGREYIERQLTVKIPVYRYQPDKFIVKSHIKDKTGKKGFMTELVMKLCYLYWRYKVKGEKAQPDESAPTLKEVFETLQTWSYYDVLEDLDIETVPIVYGEPDAKSNSNV